MFTKLDIYHCSYATFEEPMKKADPEAKYRPTTQMLLDAIRAVSVDCACESQEEMMVEEKIKKLDEQADYAANNAWTRAKKPFEARVSKLRKKLADLQKQSKKVTVKKRAAKERLVLRIKVQGATPANCKAVETLLDGKL